MTCPRSPGAAAPRPVAPPLPHAARRVAGAALLLVGSAAPGRAQQTPPAPRPTPSAPRPVPPAARPTQGDTLARPAVGDTVRATRDSVVIGVPAGSDSTRRPAADSIRGIPDTLATRVVRDSIKAPFARAESPPEPRVGQAYRWTRDSIYSTGAITLNDLLARVPGALDVRSGWIASTQAVAYLGDFRRVRIFRDGVELDAIDPRANGVRDLTDIQLWELDEVSVEQTAGELRVHLRTWTVRRTTPYTRVDASTGDQDSNLYRGFYGKRFGNGGALQVGAQQYQSGSRDQRVGGGGDVLGGFGRLGWARGAWTVDALLTRVDRTRNSALDPRFGFTTLGRYQGRRDEAYLRVGWGDPEGGPWVQAIANAARFTLVGTAVRQEIPSPTPLPPGAVPDSLVLPDTARSRTQYVLTGGFTRWGVRFSVTDRYRVSDRASWHAPSVRAQFDRAWLSVAGYAERLGGDSTTRADASARLTPLPWLAVQGGLSQQSGRAGGRTDDRTTARLEGALRLGAGLWLTGGRVQRSGARLAAPTFYGRPADSTNALPLVDVLETGAVGGTIATARGRLFKDTYAEVVGTVWDQAGAYRPRLDALAALGLRTEWRSRFPSGNFGLHFRIEDAYRSETPFPINVDTQGGALAGTTFRNAPPVNLFNILLEIRIQNAWVTYQLRNTFGREYQLVPGVTQPIQPINFYGVRWEFFN